MARYNYRCLAEYLLPPVPFIKYIPPFKVIIPLRLLLKCSFLHLGSEKHGGGGGFKILRRENLVKTCSTKVNSFFFFLKKGY